MFSQLWPPLSQKWRIICGRGVLLTRSPSPAVGWHFGRWNLQKEFPNWNAAITLLISVLGWHIGSSSSHFMMLQMLLQHVVSHTQTYWCWHVRRKWVFCIDQVTTAKLCHYSVWPEVFSSSWPDVHGVKSSFHLFSSPPVGSRTEPCLLFPETGRCCSFIKIKISFHVSSGEKFTCGVRLNELSKSKRKQLQEAPDGAAEHHHGPREGATTVWHKSRSRFCLQSRDYLSFIWQKPRQLCVSIDQTFCLVGEFPGFCRADAIMIHKKEPSRKLLTSLCLLCVPPSVHRLQLDLSVHFPTFGSSIRSICGFYSLLFLYSIIHLLSRSLGFNHPSCSLCLSVHLTRHSVVSLTFLTLKRFLSFIQLLVVDSTADSFQLYFSLHPPVFYDFFFPSFEKTIYFSVISRWGSVIFLYTLIAVVVISVYLSEAVSCCPAHQV